MCIVFVQLSKQEDITQPKEKIFKDFVETDDVKSVIEYLIRENELPIEHSDLKGNKILIVHDGYSYEFVIECYEYDQAQSFEKAKKIYSKL